MKKWCILPLLLVSIHIQAQSKANERFAFGFFAGMETQSLGVESFGNWPDEPTAWSDGSNAGISMGVFARKSIWPWLHFQPELAVSYVKNNVIFWPDGPAKFTFWDAELPLHFVLSDWRKNDLPLRGCIILGGRTGWNFAKNQDNLLNITSGRFAIDLGLGAEIKLKNWVFQPAFVYSHGMNDLHLPDNSKYDSVVGKVVRDKLALRLLLWKSKNKKKAVSYPMN